MWAALCADRVVLVLVYMLIQLLAAKPNKSIIIIIIKAQRNTGIKCTEIMSFVQLKSTDKSRRCKTVRLL